MADELVRILEAYAFLTVNEYIGVQTNLLAENI